MSAALPARYPWRDRAAGEQALVDHVADVALVFEPVRLSDVQSLAAVRQPLCVVMRPDHPLTEKEVVRLRDCAAYPVRWLSVPYGVRRLIDLALLRISITFNVAVESDSFEFLRRYPAHESLVSLQIPIRLPGPDRIQHKQARPADTCDIPEGLLYLCQLKGRKLPVAAAKFARQIEEALVAR